jgi:hypothetical protein
MGPACPITFNDGGQVLHALGHALLQPFAWRCLHPPPRLQPVAPARDDVHGSRASDAAGALPGISASGSTGPDTLGSRLYERGLVVKCGLWWSGSSCGVVVASGAHLSIASSVGGPGDMGGRLRGRKSEKGRQAARRKAAPPEAGVGAKGSLRVSMCQIASVSFLAMSIWATLAPRCLPRRCLLRW